MIDKNSAEWRLGQFGEDLVRGLLKEVGWRITELRKIENGGAPSLDGQNGFVAALPEFDCAKAGQRRFVEVKTRTDAVYNKKWRRLVHGISLRSLESYSIMEQETGSPCWLFFVEKARSNIFSAPLEILRLPMWSRMYTGENEQDRGGNIYFDRIAFSLFGTIPGQGQIFELRDGRWLPSRHLR